MDRGISRVRALIVLALVVVVGIGVAFAVGILGTPSVENVENRFAGVNETTTLIDTDLAVHNPNPIGVRLGGLTVNYTVDLNDIRMASGTKNGVNITTGNSTLGFRTAMDNERIPEWWVTHIRNGERSDLRVHATVTSSLLGQSATFSPVDRPVETDILSAFNSEETRPVNANQPLVSDPVLYVNETGAAWGSVSERQTPIDMQFTVYNPKPAPYTITEIGYTITMNDITVGEGASDREHVIPSEETETIETTTAIRNQNLDEWWVSHLERNQFTDLRIEFYARVELPGGETIRIPLDALTYTETIETDIFGTKAETEPERGSETTPPDEEGTQETTTSTPDGEGTPDTATPTGTPTETDDGVL